MNKQEEIWGELDPEVADLVEALNVLGIGTVSSCSGHGKEFGHIWLKDGRILIILPQGTTKEELCSRLVM